MINISNSDWGDPRPVGFVALIFVVVLFALLLDGRLPHHAYPLMLVFAIVGGIAQFLTGIILLKKGNTPAGGLFTAFGLFFLGGPSAMFFMLSLGLTTPHAFHFLLGVWNILLGLILYFWGITLIYGGWVEFLISPVGGTALLITGLGNLLANEMLTQIAAYLFYIFTIWAFYMLAHYLGESVGMDIPAGRPLVKHPLAEMEE